MYINNIADTEQEKDFRERYARELRKKKIHSSINSHFGLDELSDELGRVKHQAMITPGRRGEQIKHEEIGKESWYGFSKGEDQSLPEY